jgi:uncharacterized protein YcnI
MRPSSFLLTVALLTLGSSSVAQAHVTVQPSEVLAGSFQTFTVSVPNEKEMDTTGLRLVLPADLHHVTPSVKAGWTIATKKDGEMSTEISWTGGVIPSERRDTFTFSAQAPADEGTVAWKAYQTYADGTVVSWDQTPSDTEEASTPYTETEVVSELASQKTADEATKGTNVAYAALGVALVALLLQVTRRSR